jgi:hypothetical protein
MAFGLDGESNVIGRVGGLCMVLQVKRGRISSKTAAKREVLSKRPIEMVQGARGLEESELLKTSEGSPVLQKQKQR